MKIFVCMALCLLFTSLSFATTNDSTANNFADLKGKQISILDPNIANTLFEFQKTSAEIDSFVLADGQVLTQSAAQMSNAAVICSFAEVNIYQNGYFSFSPGSQLEIVSIDVLSVPSINLIQIHFKVRHSHFAIGTEHSHRQFNCSNRQGTILNRETLDLAFGSILAFK